MKQKNKALTIQEMVKWVEAGHHGRARRALLAFNLARLSREERVEFADLARRVNMPALMIKVLRPTVKPQVPIKPSASIRERALYATALSRLGVFDEAHKALEELKDADDADVILFRAYNLMFQWKSKDAIPLLRSYVARKDVTSYQRSVGMLNLASCLSSSGEFSASELVLSRLFSEISKENKLLYGNALEIAAQVAVKQRDFNRAHELIGRAERELAGGESRYELFIKKWRVVLELLKTPDAPESLVEMHKLKAEALKAGNWEVARDLDFYEAQATKNDALFLKVYFGSPYSDFRKRVLSHYKIKMPLPTFYRYSFGYFEERHGRCFSLLTGHELTLPAVTLNQQPLLYQLLLILSADFYRPIDAGTVFSQLYPDEHFNPNSSLLKVAQILKRLRKWFIDHEIPLNVIARSGKLRLIATKPYSIEVGLANAKPSKEAEWLARLKIMFENRPFTAEQAVDCLGLSRATVLKFLKQAKAMRKVMQTASGRSTRYRLR